MLPDPVLTREFLTSPAARHTGFPHQQKRGEGEDPSLYLPPLQTRTKI